MLPAIGHRFASTLLELQSVRTKFSQASLTPAQSRAQGLVSGFIDHTTNGYSLAAMVGGGLVYRLGRLGGLALGSKLLSASPQCGGPEASFLASSLVRYASIGVGFTGEVFTFEAGQRALRVGIAGEDAALLNWRKIIPMSNGF